MRYEEQDKIDLAGLIHVVGKMLIINQIMLIPNQILNKPVAFDAITSNRVYRKKRSKAEGIAEIQRCSGT